jgi:proline iminopeptidase
LDAHWRATASAERRSLLKANTAQLPEQDRISPSTAEGFVRWYVARAPFFWRDPHFDSAPLWEGAHLNMGGVGRVTSLLVENDLTAAFDRIRTPVLLMLGRYDYSAPPEIWEDERHKLPDCTLVIFEESGHGPMFEEQAAFDATLVERLRAPAQS